MKSQFHNLVTHSLLINEIIGGIRARIWLLEKIEKDSAFIKSLIVDLKKLETDMGKVHDVVENLISTCRNLKNQNDQLQAQLNAQASNLLTPDDQSALTDGQAFIDSLNASGTVASQPTTNQPVANQPSAPTDQATTNQNATVTAQPQTGLQTPTN